MQTVATTTNNNKRALELARHLFKCAHRCSSSDDKRAHLIGLPDLVWELAHAIEQQQYRPGRFTVLR